MKFSDLKSQVKNLQTALTVSRQASERHLVEKKQQGELIKDFRQERDNLQTIIDHTSNKGMHLEIKDGTTNTFLDDIVKCVVELIGEAEVPSKRCGQVIEIVSRHMFSVDIPAKDLPSERSALRFADRGHCLAKYQLAEAMSSTRFDIYTDGTTKDHQKYIGHQVTLESGETLSCGFTGVCKEDTQTLLDVALNLLTELSDVFDEELS